MAQLPTIVRKSLEFVGALSVVAQPSENGNDIGPIREASPQSDDAPPTLSSMISRSGEGGWFPGQYLDTIASNTDTILARDGSGLGLYAELADDDVCFSSLQQRRLAITSRDWEVTAGDDKDPASVKAADEFRAMIDAVGIDRVTEFLHWAVWYGYAVGEAMWTTKTFEGRTIIWLDDIIVPDRRFFGFTIKGELRYRPLDTLAIAGEIVPDNKFFTIRTGGTHDFAFYGLGLAHFAYWPIFFKRAALKFWALYLEKFGAPTVGIGYPVEEKDDTAAKSKRLEAAVAIGQDRAVLLPEQVMKDDLVKIYESERSGAGASSYDTFVKSQDEAMMRIILGQPGTSKGVASGLNSNQASEHADVKAEIVKADSDMISEAINRTLAVWVTRWNHGPDVAPPKFYRLLDDAEDINKVAERDGTLDGIGWQRTDESFKSTYGDGYERKAEPVPPAIPGALPGANVVDMAAARKARVAKAALTFGVEDRAPLYVSRKLLNAAEVIAWAKSQGIKTTVPAEDMHVTVLYSKTPVDWFDMGEPWGERDGQIFVIPGGPRAVESFGDGATVLRFYSNDLRWRHESMIERGASSDYDEYKPHITLSYDPTDVDLAKIEPFVGELRFGPEIFEPLKEDSSETDPAQYAFGAKEEEAIDRLIASLTDDASPVFAAMGDALRESLQGVTTLEGARVALLGAMESLPVKKLAELSGLPFLAVRAATSIGKEGSIEA